jgi:hypothetical protein
MQFCMLAVGVRYLNFHGISLMKYYSEMYICVHIFTNNETHIKSVPKQSKL